MLSIFLLCYREDVQQTQAAKLRCLIHYFERLCNEWPDIVGRVFYCRQVLWAYPGFCRTCSMKWLEAFLHPLYRMLVHLRSLPHNLLGFPNNLPIPIYSPGSRESLWELSVLPKNTTQCPWPMLEPRPLDPETSVLTRRPLHLHTKDINHLDFS